MNSRTPSERAFDEMIEYLNENNFHELSIVMNNNSDSIISAIKNNVDSRPEIIKDEFIEKLNSLKNTSTTLSPRDIFRYTLRIKESDVQPFIGAYQNDLENLNAQAEAKPDQDPVKAINDMIKYLNENDFHELSALMNTKKKQIIDFLEENSDTVDANDAKTEFIQNIMNQNPNDLEDTFDLYFGITYPTEGLSNLIKAFNNDLVKIKNAEPVQDVEEKIETEINEEASLDQSNQEIKAEDKPITTRRKNEVLTDSDFETFLSSAQASRKNTTVKPEPIVEETTETVIIKTNPETIQGLDERIRPLFETGEFKDIVIGRPVGNYAEKINSSLLDEKMNAFAIAMELRKLLTNGTLHIEGETTKIKTQPLEPLSKSIFAQVQYSKILEVLETDEVKNSTEKDYLKSLLSASKDDLIEKLKNSNPISVNRFIAEIKQNAQNAGSTVDLGRIFDSMLGKQKIKPENKDEDLDVPQYKYDPSEKGPLHEKEYIDSSDSFPLQTALISSIKELFDPDKGTFPDISMANSDWLNDINLDTEITSIREKVEAAIFTDYDLEIPAEIFLDNLKRNETIEQITSAIANEIDILKRNIEFSFENTDEVDISPGKPSSTSTTSPTTTSTTTSTTTPTTTSTTTPTTTSTTTPTTTSTTTPTTTSTTTSTTTPTTPTSPSTGPVIEDLVGEPTEVLSEPAVTASAKTFGRLTENEAKEFASNLHKLNAVMGDNDSLKMLNETLTHKNFRSHFIGPKNPLPVLTQLTQFKALEALIDDTYPLGKKLKDLAENPNSEEAYKAFKEAAYNLEHVADKYTKERGLLFKSPPKREIAFISQSVERLIEQVQSTIGSHTGAADEKERLRNLERCTLQITAINEVIGQLKQHSDTVHDKDIKNLLEKREKLNKLVDKTLQKTNHKKIRVYGDQGAPLPKEVALEGETDKEKMQSALSALGLASDSDLSNFGTLSPVNSGIAKYKQEDKTKFLVYSGRGAVINDPDDVNAYHRQIDPENAIEEKNPKQEVLSLNYGVGMVGNRYMGIMSIGEQAGYRNDEGDYLITDEKLLEFAAEFVLNFHTTLPPADKGKRLVLSEAVHPRVVQAIHTYCELSDEKFEKPRAPSSYNADRMAKNSQSRYKSKMEAHMRTEEFKERVKQVKEASVSAKEEQARNRPTTKDKILDNLNISKRPR